MMFVLLVIGGWEARRFFPYPTFLARLGVENWQVWEFHDYFNISPNTLSVVLDDRRLTTLEDPPVMNSGDIFFPASFVREHIDPFMFWDDGAQTLFVSTDTEIIRLPDQNVPMAFIQNMYTTFQVEHRAEYNTIIIANLENMWAWDAETTRRTAIRYRPDRTAFITTWAENGTTLTAFPSTEHETDYFTRVRTEEGLLGYVLTSDILTTMPPIFFSSSMPLVPPRSPNINLTWEMITAPQGNVTAMNNPLPVGLNVVSPTWFNFDPVALNGDIISFASRAYVEWAHAQGVEVWAKAFDSSRDISHAILTNYQARERAIAQLIQFATDYNLDGININFEHVRSTDGGYYLQFLRELAPEMRRIGATLSVATFVPASWHSQYHHELVGRTVDFVAIMTYDEHVGNSPEPGPVASLPFVDRFIGDTLELIPGEKILMGIPLYNRLWRVSPDGSHTSRALGMYFPWTLIEEWGVTPTWDETIGSYYANFTTADEDGSIVTYRIWVECERSIREKLRIFSDNDLAGVASWRRGLESEGVWEVIDLSLNQEV